MLEVLRALTVSPLLGECPARADRHLRFRLPPHRTEQAGQLPQSAGIRIAWRETETSFVLNAEQLSLSGLTLQTALGNDEEAPSPLLEEMKGGGRKRKQVPALPDESDVMREAFYERMRLTQELEALLEALYADFVALRLSSLWASAVVPAARAWAQGRDVDADAYRRARTPKAKAQSKRA
jgi:hypothetical protein